MANYCQNCGSRTYEDSLFCETCGYQLTTSKLKRNSVNTVQSDYQQRPIFMKKSKQPRYHSNLPSTTTNVSPYAYRKKSSRHFGLFLGVIIIGIVGIGAVSALIFGIIPIVDEVTDPHQYIGSKDYSIEAMSNITTLEVIIDNSIGSINVQHIENMTKLFDAQLHVYARKNYDLAGSKDLEIQQGDDLYTVLFETSSEVWNNPYTYDIDLYISNKAKSYFDIEVSTGSITFGATKTEIQELFLETSTGSIEASFEDVLFNNSIYNHYILYTSTGSVLVRLNNISYSSTINEHIWDISTSTGSVSFELYQDYIQNSSINVNFDVSTSTGSVTCIYRLNDLIGYSLDASTSLGDVTIFGSGISLPYISDNYQEAISKYDILLSTSTGSIEIIQEG
ncbi:MAG: hypothetical protein ACFFAU_10000 [Candidatus Hodarchaeota archaeon]